MAEPEEKTFEALLLEDHPEVRNTVLASEEFIAWRNRLPSVVVDGVKYYIRGGDMLKDEDQIVVEWARKTRLLHDG
jgi:hypothetical protein